VEENLLYINEERRGELNVDQRVEGDEDEEYIHMSRPYTSLYRFEYAMGSLLADSYHEHCVDEDDLDWDEFDFDEMYR